MNTQPFILFGITPPVFTFAQLSLVNSLFHEGLDYLYIRSEETKAAAWQQQLEKIDPAFYSRLLLPGNAPATAAGGEYIHHVREKERAARKQGPGRCSTSVHDLALVPPLAGSYQYVFFSPLFPSISKPGYGPQQQLASVEKQLAELRATNPALPGIIGLGGVGPANVARVKAAGFQGAALLGALWESDAPVERLARVRQALAGQDQ